MNEELNQEIEQPISNDISEEQIEKFFETGGKETPNQETVDESQTEGEVNTQTPPSPESIEQQKEQMQLEEEKHARNYQAAMKEERARRQELQQKVAVMEDRFQKIMEFKQQENQPKVPSYDEDPLEHLRVALKETQDYAIQQNQFLQQQQEVVRMQQAEAQFINAYSEKAVEYQQQNPEFLDAYNYYATKKMAEYVAGGLTPKEADYQIKLEEAKIVSAAFKQGVNPAERIYAMAKASGFTKVNNEPIKNTSAMDETAKKLEQIQRDIKANRSLSNAAGKTDTKQGLSLQAIADMDDDEFDKVDWSKVIKAA